ncbi:MAG: restriction endonuclease [Sumerlaeia bacterium]
MSFDELLEFFVLLPWWVGPPVAGFAWAVLHGVGSALAGQQDLVAIVFAKLLPAFAPYVAIFIALIWLASLLQRAQRRRLLDRQDGIASIRALTWLEFEHLVGEAYRRDGYLVEERGSAGGDGGIDLLARREGEVLLVQCKRWRTWKVGAPVVREMYGLLAAGSASGAVIVTTGEFTGPAREFAAGKPIRLMNGNALAEFVKSVQRPSPARPPTAPSPTKEPEVPPLPNCQRCGAPMTVRTARRGPNPGERFLGCTRFPKCRGTQPLPSQPSF